MAAFLKKMRSKKVKTPDEPVTSSNSVETFSGSEDSEVQTTTAISSSDYCEDQSPEHKPISVTGSLFSGMVLSKTARKQETDASPYLQRRSEDSQFTFLNSVSDTTCESDTSQLGFSFIKAGHDTAEGDIDHDSGEKSSFCFLHKSTDIEPAEDTRPTCSSFEFISGESETHLALAAVSSNDSPITSLFETSNVHDQSSTEPLSSSSQKAPLQKVNRQAPPISTRKKKHKAIRPGQERYDDSYSGLLQIIALPEHNSQPSDSVSAESLLETGKEGKPSLDSTITCTTTITTDAYESVELPKESADKDFQTEHLEMLAPVSQPTVAVTVEKSIDKIYLPLVDSPVLPHETEGISIAKGDSIPPSPKLVVVTCSDLVDVVQISQSIAEDLLSQSAEDIVGQPQVIIRQPDIICKDVISQPDVIGDDAVCQPDVIGEDLGDANDGTSAKKSSNAVELSETERQDSLLEIFSSNILKVRFESDRLHNDYGLRIENISSCLRSRISERESIQTLKSKEDAALAEENYELAEELRRELESVEDGKSIPLNNGHTIIKEWLDECQTHVASEITLSEQVLDHLTKLESEQSEDHQSFEKEFSLQHAKKKMDLQTMADKIEKEKGHIALDREHLEKKQQILQDEVTHRAAEFIAYKEQLEQDQKEVDEEIVALEDKLKGLQEKKIKLVALISCEDDKIQIVYNELSSNQEELDKEKCLLKQGEDELQQQMARLKELQMDYDSAKKEHDDSSHCFLSAIDSCKTRSTEILERKRQLQETQSETRSWTICSISDYRHQSERLKCLLENEQAKDNEMKLITSKVLTYQSELSTLHKHICDIESQVSKLQESKKTAVAARQYREASKLANEEKEFLAKLETNKQQLNCVDAELSSQTRLLCELNEELNVIKEERALVEKQEDIEHIQSLVSSVLLQDSQLSKLSGGSTVPMYDVLEQWCSIHKLLIQDLCSKHGIDINDYLTEHCGNTTMIEAVERSKSPVNDEEHDVGMEESPLDNIEGTKESNRMKIMNLELRISKACEEEKFDVAAELDEELDLLKSLLKD